LRISGLKRPEPLLGSPNFKIWAGQGGIPMAREQFFVLLHEGRWKIKHNGQHSRPYNTKVEAIKDAIDQAHDAQKKGCLSSVVVQSDTLPAK